MSSAEHMASPHDSPASSFAWWKLGLLVLFTLAARGGILAVQSERLSDDPDAYRELAETVRAKGIYGWYTDWGKYGYPDEPAVPTAYRPPLYPLLLAVVAVDGKVASGAVAAVHLALGLATVLLVWRMGEQWGLGDWSYAAAALVAVDPILLNQSTLVMTETLAAFVTALALGALTRYWQTPTLFWAGACGAAIALAMLCRPTYAVWLAFAAIPVAWLPGEWTRRCGNAAAYVLMAAFILAPWVVRNALVMGQPIVTTTHGGYTLWLANNAIQYGEAQEPSFERHISMVSGLDRSILEKLDPRFSDLAWTHIRRHPGQFLLASLYRLSRLWGVLPLATEEHESTPRMLARWGVAAWYSLLLAAAIVGLWRLGRDALAWPWLPGLLLCLAFTLVHLLYWTDLRMRGPLMPFVCLVAAYGLAQAIAWVRTPPAPPNDKSRPLAPPSGSG